MSSSSSRATDLVPDPHRRAPSPILLPSLSNYISTGVHHRAPSLNPIAKPRCRFVASSFIISMDFCLFLCTELATEKCLLHQVGLSIPSPLLIAEPRPRSCCLLCQTSTFAGFHPRAPSLSPIVEPQRRVSPIPMLSFASPSVVGNLLNLCSFGFWLRLFLAPPSLLSECFNCAAHEKSSPLTFFGLDRLELGADSISVSMSRINQEFFRGYAIIAAAREGHCNILGVLLKVGVSQSACEDALLEASLCGEAEAVQLLIQSEMVRPDAAAHALVMASSRGFLDVVDTLIKNGVDIYCLDRVLCARSSLQCMQMLIVLLWWLQLSANRVPL